MAESDTIFALATPPGRSALAVFRISGAQAGYVLEMLSGRAVPEARRVVLRAISDPDSGERIDTGLATFFKGPASFTGDLSVMATRWEAFRLASMTSCRVRNLLPEEPTSTRLLTLAQSRVVIATLASRKVIVQLPSVSPRPKDSGAVAV